MRALLVCLALIIGLVTPVAAGDDIAAARSTIQSQTDAIGRDDATAAYGFAAPSIQNIFPRPDIFLSMVRRSYAPIYRHKSFEFGEARTSDGQILQDVHIIDADGEAWEALLALDDWQVRAQLMVLDLAHGIHSIFR